MKLTKKTTYKLLLADSTFELTEDVAVELRDQLTALLVDTNR